MPRHHEPPHRPRPLRMALLALPLLVPALLAAAAPATAAAELSRSGQRDDWTWGLVDPRGIGLGGGGLDADDVRYVHDQGFRAILNYRAEHPDDADAMRALGMGYLLLPGTYAEEDTMPLDHVHQAVAFIEKSLQEGRPVYVHCTGGWHRSAVGVVAFYMKERGWRVQEAWDHVAKARPGVEMRYADVLYAYEAFLRREEKLTLDLWTERWDVSAGETVGLTALVTHHGRPVEGAEVRYVMDHRGHEERATTGPDGRATFRFTAPKVDLMQYVSATATKDGFVPGYDRNVYWVKGSKDAPPTVFEMAEPPARVEPGERVSLPVKVREGPDKPTNARVTVTSRCATLFRAYGGWDGRMDVDFTAPDKPGEYVLRVHVHRFPAEPIFREVRLVVGAGGPEPPCGAPPKAEPARDAPPEKKNEPAEAGEAAAPAPGPETPVAKTPLPGAAALLAGVALAALVLRRGRQR